jgi:drug/metabolite transporter (DMT)-like permease
LPSPSGPPWIAAAALACGVLCIAWSAIFVSLAVGVAGPASAFYRALIATAVLVPIWLARRPRAPSRQTLRLIALAGFFFALDLAAYNTAVLDTTAAMGTLLGNISPICVGLATWLLFRAHPERHFWMGLAVAFAGIVTIVGSDILHHPTLGIGDALGITAGICFAGYIIVTAQARATADTLTVATLSIAATAVVLLLICVGLRTPLTGYRPASWAAVAGLGLISQVLGYLALTYALGKIPPTLTSLGLLSQAPLTALLGFAVLGERLTAAQIAGGAIVLSGIYIATRRGAGASSAPAPATSRAISAAREPTA